MGSILGKIYLGELYRNNHQGGTNRSNLKRAFNLFTEAAEAGHPFAMFLLAHCYRNGIGTKIDH